MRVLIVEDDVELGPLLVSGLDVGAVEGDLVVTGAEAIARATESEYAAIVLDVGLPDLDGFEVCRAMRREGIETPILFLSGRGTIADRVQGLDAGGDDYLIKPFAFSELAARLRALSRRGKISRGVVLQVGDLWLDPACHQAHRGDVAIDLTRKEYALLEVLMREPGRVLSRDTLLHQGWGVDYQSRSNVVETLIHCLRTKVDRPFGCRSVETVRGVGWRIHVDLPGV